MLTLNVALKPLNLAVRPLLHLYVVYCSVSLPCSSALPCGEQLGPRFQWDTL
jgi:hypothetical protein